MMADPIETALEAIAAKRAATQESFGRIVELVFEARGALDAGDRAKASRLLTEAADAEFEATGDANTIGELLDALGLEDASPAFQRRRS
jgi:hypothetical protein